MGFRGAASLIKHFMNIFAQPLKMALHKNVGVKAGHMVIFLHEKVIFLHQKPKNAFFLHGEISNLPPIIQHVNFAPFFVNKGTRKRMKIVSMYIVFGLV